MANKIFATKAGVIEKITILGNEYDCESAKGEEYTNESGGRFDYGFPFHPYKIESVITNVDEKNSTAAFLLDDSNIIWVHDGDGVFVRPSLAVGLTYIKMYDYCSHPNVLNIINEAD